MKKNLLLLVCTVLIGMSSTFAANVTVQDAQTVAVNFFKTALGSSAPRILSATLQSTRTETDNTVDYYVFSMSPVKGFVIVSATDNDEPIIGYSTESYFPNDISKIGLNEWLNRWATELHYVKQHNIVATSWAAPRWAAFRQGVVPAVEKASSVNPMCLTTWDQNTEYSTGPNLYNNFCPGGTGENQAVTGCVATAMAQIMKFWNYPPKGIGSNSYSDERPAYQENYGTLSANFADSVFDWTAMETPMLTSTSTTTQINAIGMLMSCAGIAVDMDYDPDGSGAFVLTAEDGGSPCAQTAYVKNFGYQNIITGVGLSGTSSGATVNVASAAFIDSIETDLNAGHLVEVQGTDRTNGGHTWVCDGYNTSNDFHMNWGWSGYADGYFAVTSLNPNDGEQLDFTEDVAALLHIIPPTTNTIPEIASATISKVCPGAQTQLSATTHTNATYSWTPTTALSNAAIANPVASPTATTTYTVNVDSAGIIGTSSVTITVSAAPSAIMGSSTNPACYGSSNGSITVAGSGGTPSYSYLWSDNQTTATATNLPQGTYTVTITDANSCTATASKAITQPASAVTASTSNVINATCGQSNGSITGLASGGTSGYTYLWSNGASTAAISGLGAATYTITVTDAHSCTAKATASITSSGTLNLSLSATNATCHGTDNGSASATVSGSTGTVTYDWSNGATTSSIQNAGAATYTVTITDGSGCSATSSKTITQPLAITALVSTTNTGCGNSAIGGASVAVTGGTAGYSYLWNNNATTASISGLSAGTYDVTITDANHCSTSTSASVTGAGAVTLTPATTNAGCGSSATGTASVTATGGTGYSYLWSNGSTAASVTGLTSGTYQVTVTDAANCSGTVAAIVGTSSPVTLQASAVNATCYGDNSGGAQVSASSGASPYSYLWSNSATSASISGVAAGTYAVTVTDANSCSSTADAIVTQPAQIQLTTTETNAIGTHDDGTAKVNNITGGGVAPYSYLWSNGDTTQTAAELGAGTYTVTVTDAHGCNSTASVTVNVSTGINNVSNVIAFSVYPNPAHNYVLVQLDQFNASTVLNLKNILGQTVITQAVTAQQTQVDLGSLANGVYLVELVQGEKVAVKQLVIVK